MASEPPNLGAGLLNSASMDDFDPYQGSMIGSRRAKGLPLGPFPKVDLGSTSGPQNVVVSQKNARHEKILTWTFIDIP